MNARERAVLSDQVARARLAHERELVREVKLMSRSCRSCGADVDARTTGCDTCAERHRGRRRRAAASERARVRASEERRVRRERHVDLEERFWPAGLEGLSDEERKAALARGWWSTGDGRTLTVEGDVIFAGVAA